MGQSASASANTQHRKITSQDKAILQLKKSRDNLNKFTHNTYKLIDNENAELKKMIRSCKETGSPVKSHPQIKLLLKRVHYQKILITRANDQLSNLDEMLSNIEFKLIEKKFITGLQQGNDILKKLNNELNVDFVQDVMDNVQDEMAYEREVDQVLTSNMENITDAVTDSRMVLDTELDQELEVMAASLGIAGEQPAADEQHKVKLPDTSQLPDLPKVEESPEREEQEEQKESAGKQRVMVPS
ncbi:hypothetical protein ACO0RG_003934 [Hanseniaspora osmophila]